MIYLSNDITKKIIRLLDFATDFVLKNAMSAEDYNMANRMSKINRKLKKTWKNSTK